MVPCIFQHPAVLPQKLINYDASGGGYIQGMLQTEHGNADVSVAHAGQSGRHAINLVSKNNADWKARNPIENIHRACAGLNDCQFVGEVSHSLSRGDGLGMMFPTDRFLSSQSCLADTLLRRGARDAAQQKHFDGSGIGGTKKRAYVIKTPEVFEHYRHRQPDYVVVGLGTVRDLIRYTLIETHAGNIARPARKTWVMYATIMHSLLPNLMNAAELSGAIFPRQDVINYPYENLPQRGSIKRVRALRSNT